MTHAPPPGFFASALERYAERPCLVVPDGARLTYGELLARADALAREVGAGRRLVLIEGRRCTAAVAAYVGCLRAGHVVHLVDPEKPASLAGLIASFSPDAVIRCDGANARVEALAGGGELHPELAVLLATSGSTGSQKLVKLSYANVQSNTEAIVEYLGIRSDDRAVTSLNLHYSFGLSILNSHLAAGASLLLTELSIQDSRFWQLASRERVTSFSGVPYSFELLERLGVDLAQLPSLRTVTQAGGRLAPALVRRFAALGQKQGWRFFVMYGQTEAAPRMAYLPPELAAENADCIGVAIPGGRFQIATEDGALGDEVGREGELVYAGPNIMIGYAHTRADLAGKETIPRLFTGDLAVKTANGLFRIIGRKSRFAKPFGLRVSLDDVESALIGAGLRCAAVARDDEIVVFADRAPAQADPLAELAEQLALPESIFELRVVPEIPLLGTGKTDYRALERLAREARRAVRPSRLQLARRFLRESAAEFVAILFGGAQRWASVREIFEAYFPAEEISPDKSFVALGGDSLRYVEVGVCLAELLPSVPDDWQERSLEELQAQVDLPAA